MTLPQQAEEMGTVGDAFPASSHRGPARPLRVLLVGNYAPDRQESMKRFESLMKNGLAEAGHEVTAIRPPALLGRFVSGYGGAGKWLGYVDKYLLFPALLRAAARQAEIVHICDHSNAMYSRWIGRAPCIVTCHDLLAVRGALGEETDTRPSWTGRYLQRWIVRGMKRATRLVSVSSATAADVQRVLGRGKPDGRVVLNALNHPYRPLSREEALPRLAAVTQGHRGWRAGAELDLSTPFVLHVGQNHRRKNRPCVIRAFARAARQTDLQLVLAGPPLTPELRTLVRAEGVADQVKVIVKPSNEVLEALYNLALALLFPSRFEGFGWPLIEAQACGCPVICSRCAPFPEIVAESAICRDADDEPGFAEAIVRLARDEAERDSWIQRGLRNAERFRPARMIARYLDAYRELLGPR